MITPSCAQSSLAWSSRFSARGFSLMELLVVMGIVSVLASLLFPLLKKSQDRALESRCMENLKNLHVGITLYAGDNDGTYPINQKTAWSGWWQGLYLGNYVEAEAFYCPTDRTGFNPGTSGSFNSPSRVPMRNGKVSYGGMGDPQTGSGNLQAWGKKMSRFTNTSVSVLLSEDQQEGKQLREPWFVWTPRWVSEVKYAHQNGTRANLLFMDGHITSITRNQFQDAVNANQIIISFP